MSFNTKVNTDPRSFFYYKDDFYINGTEIVLKDEYINTHNWNGRKLWKYAKYDHQTHYNGRVSYFFCQSRCNWVSLRDMGVDPKTQNDYAAYFVVDALDLENAIEEIVKPIKLERTETEVIKAAIVEPKSDFDNVGLMLLWIAYIAIMIGSLIFKEFYIIWAIVSFLFFKLRKEMLS